MTTKTVKQYKLIAVFSKMVIPALCFNSAKLIAGFAHFFIAANTGSNPTVLMIHKSISGAIYSSIRSFRWLNNLLIRKKLL